jgi:hypothetical protein
VFEVFYNQAIRKMTVAFGSLFNNVYVQRLDSSGAETSRIRVPLGYGPKEKYIRRLREASTLGDSRDVEITLPRMSFEMSSALYDPSRKKNTLQQRFISHSNNNKVFNNYTEVPYDFNFSVSAMVKFMEDGLCILEQVLPYFTPEFTITVNISDINQKIDIPVILNSVEINEDYEGDFESRRMIIIDLDFTAKSYVYGPTKTSGIIQKAITTIFEPSDGFYYEGGSAGVSGTEGAKSKVTVGVTGPSGASSGVDNFTGYTTNTRVYGMTGSDGISLDGTNL